MVDDMDVLVKWSRTIATAEWWVSEPRPYSPTAESCCIAELAASVRAQREEMASWKDIVTGGRQANKELSTRIAQLQAMIADSQDRRLGHFSEIQRLRERVMDLEIEVKSKEAT